MTPKVDALIHPWGVMVNSPTTITIKSEVKMNRILIGLIGTVCFVGLCCSSYVSAETKSKLSEMDNNSFKQILRVEIF